MKSILLVLVGLIGLTTAKGDILRLRDGRMFTGQFLGATRDQIYFQAEGPGEILGAAGYSVAQVESLTFGPDAKQSKTASAKCTPEFTPASFIRPAKSVQVPRHANDEDAVIPLYQK